jgi:hypothetical protein
MLLGAMWRGRVNMKRVARAVAVQALRQARCWVYLTVVRRVPWFIR